MSQDLAAVANRREERRALIRSRPTEGLERAANSVGASLKYVREVEPEDDPTGIIARLRETELDINVELIRRYGGMED